MNLRSKLGISLATFTLGAALACGPKPSITNETNTIGDNSDATYTTHVDTLYSGPTSEGIVTLTQTTLRGEFHDLDDDIPYGDIPYYLMSLRPSGSDSQITYYDPDSSGILGDNVNDEVRTEAGEISTLLGVQSFSRLVHSPSYSWIHFTTKQGPIQASVVEESRMLVQGPHNSRYQRLLREIVSRIKEKMMN